MCIASSALSSWRKISARSAPIWRSRRNHCHATTDPSASTTANITMTSCARWWRSASRSRSRASATRSIRSTVAAASELAHDDAFTVRLAEPLRQLDSARDDALVAILGDRATVRAFAEDGEVFLGHKQAVLALLWDRIFQLIHRFCVGKLFR